VAGTREPLRRARTRGATALRAAGGRVVRHLPSIVLASAAAGLAYLLAAWLFGAPQAFFAPIAAVVCVSISPGQRTRRAAEIALGVVVGLVAADLLVRVAGTGTWQLSAAVLAAMTVAVALRAGTLVTNQAAVAAVLVTAVAPTLGGHPLVRLGDALVGGAVGLTLNAVVPRDPRHGALRALDGALGGLADVLRRLAGALRDRDLAGAEAALDALTAVARTLPDLDQEIDAVAEAGRLAPRRARRTAATEPIRVARRRLDLLLVSVRSAARAVAARVRHADEHAAADLEPAARALDLLADGVAALARHVHGEASAQQVVDAGRDATVAASAVLRARPPASSAALAVQVRSGAVDLLRAVGLDQAQAVRHVEEAGGTLDASGADDVPGGEDVGDRDVGDRDVGQRDVG